MPGEILIGIGKIRGEVGSDIKESILKQASDLIKKHEKKLLGIE